MTRVETIRPKRVGCHDYLKLGPRSCVHMNCHAPLGMYMATCHWVRNFSVIVLSCSMETHKESDCCTVHGRKHQLWRHPCLFKIKHRDFIAKIWENRSQMPPQKLHIRTDCGPLKSFTHSQEATLLVPPLQIPYQNLGPRSHSTHARGWIAASSCTPKCLWLIYCLVAHTVFLRTNRSVYLKKSTPS